MIVNDVHSQLNPSAVDAVVPVDSIDSIRAAVERAAAAGTPVAIAGGRHAMGGQQFCAGGVLLDTGSLARVLAFDDDAGTIEVEAGIQWPALLDYLAAAQQGRDRQWGIRQKQTGADRLSIGGALAANVHGRGLTMPPIVADVDSLVLVSADGAALRCSRHEEAELFRLVVGGYGLFGCVYSVTLRLARRQTLERVVEVIQLDELVPRLEARIADGHLYGDFQFATDETSDDFLRTGVFASYRPADEAGPPPAGQRAFSRDDWNRLLYLAHADKGRAFAEYSAHYLATSGQLYYSDLHQLADYADDYHHAIDERLAAPDPGSEMISELYVPRDRLTDFMAAVRDDFRRHSVDVIYGTIRIVERDEESFLAWAREPWACIIFNLHTVHTPTGIERSAEAFRRLIDRAVERGGSYYLTYHRWATREQLEACYPQFGTFLRLKCEYDAAERFQSDWYRYYRSLFAAAA